MTDEAKRCVDWLNAIVKKGLRRKIYLKGDEFDPFNDNWLWLDVICGNAFIMIESLSAELEMVKRERDAALVVYACCATNSDTNNVPPSDDYPEEWRWNK